MYRNILLFGGIQVAGSLFRLTHLGQQQTFVHIHAYAFAPAPAWDELLAVGFLGERVWSFRKLIGKGPFKNLRSIYLHSQQQQECALGHHWVFSAEGW